MLLTIDEIDNDDIKKAFGTEAIKQAKPVKVGRRFKLSRILIPAISALLIVIILGSVWFFKLQEKIKWARQVAIPEIRQMIGNNDFWRNLVEPYRLAEKAETILGRDTTLAALFQQCSRNIDLLTNPPDAKVYMKEYVKPDTVWSFLGTTPLKKIRVPIGIFRWKLEKEGYDTVMAANYSWDPGGGGGSYNLVRTLDKKGSLPVGMVRVPATETEIGRLVDFFIGRYEVTNREYKKFVNDGGYQKQKYWKHLFMKDDQKLTWEEAMRVFVDQTGRPGPATWTGGDYSEGQGDYPVSGVSWYEAEAYAEWDGKCLPTSIHWDVARGAYTPMIQWPMFGGFTMVSTFSNFGGKGPVKVGSLPGVTAYGAYDMAGNVKEWCWNEAEGGRVIRGGSWEDNTYEFGNERLAPPMDRSPRNGFRLALYQDTGAVPRAAFGLRTPDIRVDYRSQKPVSDAIFQVYREQFTYDQGELNPKVDSRKENPEGWIHEIVSFNAAYGKERILAHLFLPSNVNPPYQTVIYFPGSTSVYTPSSDKLENYYEFTMFLSYLVRNGRAVLYPIYKGTFERGDTTLAAIHPGANTHAYTEFLIQLVKDFKRSIDYLQTRPDIDKHKLAYFGMSWGGALGAIIPALEERLNVSILLAGGMNLFVNPPPLPPANQINYVTRVRTPTLMLNGRYDNLYPSETSARLMFDLLGTPKEDKRQIFYETDHIPPRAEYIKEILAWLDKYLGPVK